MSPTLTASERVAALEQRLGATFKDPALALCALTHKSYLNEHRHEAGSDYERLEFLGDAVVDLAVSQRLMELYPLATEGELSKMRALLVHEEGLARVSRGLGLGEVLLLGRGEDRSGGKDKSSVLADVLEAVYGAVYLSEGLDKVLALVDLHFAQALREVAEGGRGRDYKTLLQERAQGLFKSPPRYRVVGESGPDHEKRFEVEVWVTDVLRATAKGRNKKEAEQAAAKLALEALEGSPPEPNAH